MTDSHTTIMPTLPSSEDVDLNRRIDALASGECTEDEFLLEALSADSGADRSWDVLAFIDQHYRRGQLPGPTFESIKTRISKRALDDRGVCATVELFPRAAAGTAAADPGQTTVAAGGDGGDPAPFEPRAAAVSAAETGPLAGHVLKNRFRLRRRVGHGGMGDVYEATDGLAVLSARADRHVAVKILRRPSADCPGQLTNLRREFEYTRKLSHPNIVKAFEFHSDEELAFYTMEFLDGGPLAEVIAAAAGRPPTQGYAFAVIGAVGAALAHAHSRNVIHGDMSPKNVMITRAGEVRVLDFGSSRTLHEGGAPPGTAERDASVTATPEYASCELLEGRQPDPRDDIYALACLAYELLAGVHPFAGRRSTEARDLGLTASRPSGLNRSQWRILESGLAWSRELRPLTVREWLVRFDLEPAPERLPSRIAADDSFLRHRYFAPRPVLAISAVVLLVLYAGWRAVPHETASEGEFADVPATAASVPPANTDGGAVARLGALPRPTWRVPDAARLPAAITPAAMTMPPLPPIAPVGAAVEESEWHGNGRLARAASAIPAVAGSSAITFAPGPFTVAPGSHFAEIRLQRSKTTLRYSSFVWWTESASAKASVDFIAQPRAIYTFARARRQATVFVRLLANPHRTHEANFRVCSSARTAGTADSVVCSPVLLPPRTTG